MDITEQQFPILAKPLDFSLVPSIISLEIKQELCGIILYKRETYKSRGK